MKKSPIIIAIIILILIISIGLFRGGQSTLQNLIAPSPKPTASMAPYATSTLSLSSLPTVSATGIYSLPITIDATTSTINGVQMEISYDPKKITNIAIAQGSLFKTFVILLNKIDTTKGIITYTLVAPLGNAGQKGSGTLASITFQKVSGATGFTTLQFLPQTQVSATGQSKSVLRQTFGSTFQLK